MRDFLPAFLLFAAAFANAVPEVAEAAQHNSGMAGKLLDLQNYCGFAERQPTEGDIFSVAGISAVSLIPQSNNTTSDRASPSLLWSLAVQYPTTAAFKSAPSAECGGHDNLFEIYNPSGLRFDGGKLAYEYGKSMHEVPLSLDGPNPVPLVLDASALRQADFETLIANLSAKLSGKLAIGYSYRKTVWMVVCKPAMGEGGEIGGTYCGCESETAVGTTTYEKELLDERGFFVETGPSQEFWVSPPLEKRLEGSQREQVIFFSRRLLAKISAVADGKLVGEGSTYKYNVGIGRCGEKFVDAVFAPHGNNMALNVSNESVFPFQLVDKNASYLPFYAEFEWNETAGRKEMLLSAEDRFGGMDSFSRSFSVRRPDAFSGGADGEMEAGALGEGNEAMNIRKGSDTQTPAAYPAAQKNGPLPSFSSLVIIFVLPFAFGAIAVVRWLSHLHGK